MEITSISWDVFCFVVLLKFIYVINMQHYIIIEFVYYLKTMPLKMGSHLTVFFIKISPHVFAFSRSIQVIFLMKIMNILTTKDWNFFKFRMLMRKFIYHASNKHYVISYVIEHNSYKWRHYKKFYFCNSSISNDNHIFRKLKRKWN